MTTVSFDNWLDACALRGFTPSATFRQCLEELDRADAVAVFTKDVIPGLAQTLQYAQWIMREFHGVDAPFVDSAASLRVEQRIRLRERGITPHLVTTEAALRRQVGPRVTWREQLLALTSCESLRVLTGSASDHAIRRLDNFVLLHREDAESSTLTYWPTLNGVTTRLDDPKLCDEMSAVFDDLMQTALQPTESSALIRRILEETE